jgi:hypothetical protein
MKAVRHKAAAEIVRDGAWGARLDVLRVALTERKPDALQRIRGEIMRLDGQIFALKNRCSLAAASAENQQRGFEAGEERRHQRALEMLAERRASMPDAVQARVARMEGEIATLEQMVGDLAALIRHLKAEPLSGDYGATPETGLKRKDWLAVYRQKGRITQDQSDAGEQFAKTFEAQQASARSCLNPERGSGDAAAAVYYGGESARLAGEATVAAIQAMGPVDSAAVIAVAINCIPISAWANRMGCTEDDGYRALHRGLNALHRHYGLTLSGNFGR